MRRVVVGVMVLSLVCSQAFGWSEAGHKIIASIAFRQLTPVQQERFVAILRNHPRWNEDFYEKKADGLTSDSEVNEWYFQQSAVWPDMARGLKGEDKKFNHPKWHYIDLPSYLTPDDQAALEGTLTENISLDPPEQVLEEMNAVQAIKLARKMLVNKATPDADKALMLCWLMHDVGDIHQPLHSTALYSKNLFPKGDRGGNSIKIEQRGNLHSLWDQFLGDRASFRTVHNKAALIVNDPGESKIGKGAGLNLDVRVWLTESHALAESTVYDAELVGYLRGYSAQKEAPPIKLTERYLEDGGDAARQRVIQAGYRLGNVLRQVLSNQQSTISNQK